MFWVFYHSGKGQGTPMLRDGIHCIGVDEVDEESELSDWQGFEWCLKRFPELSQYLPCISMFMSVFTVKMHVFFSKISCL